MCLNISPPWLSLSGLIWRAPRVAKWAASRARSRPASAAAAAAPARRGGNRRLSADRRHCVVAARNIIITSRAGRSWNVINSTGSASAGRPASFKWSRAPVCVSWPAPSAASRTLLLAAGRPAPKAARRRPANYSDLIQMEWRQANEINPLGRRIRPLWTSISH